MDIKQIQSTITTLQRSIRDAQKELAEVENFDSADYQHVMETQRILSDQMQLLMQLKEEVMQMKEEVMLSAASPSAVSVSQQGSESTHEAKTMDVEKRQRGGQKQYYLHDNGRRQEYVAHVRSLFDRHYNASTRKFILPDGTPIKAALFLACLYDLGIKNELASAGAPVKDFADIVKEAAVDIPNFTTAYNTIQTVVKEWRTFIGSQGYGDLTLHLHKINPSSVLRQHLSQYESHMQLLHRVEEMG